MALISAFIFCFTLCWNEFIYALTFISSSEIKTLPGGVVTELVEGDDAVMATRRPRSPGDPAPWVVQVMAVDPERRSITLALVADEGRTF